MFGRFVFAGALWLFKTWLVHPFITNFVLAIILLLSISVWVIRPRKKKQINQEPPVPDEPDRRNTTRRLTPEEVTAKLNENVTMMFGETATWKWQSDQEREETFAQGQGFIVVTNDNGLTTVLVDILSGSVRMIFVDFVPLQEIHTDYSLVAFEWLNTHLEELMALFSNAAGNGKTTTLLAADILPEKQAWEDLCHEIENNGDGFTAAVCDDGICVTFPVA